MARIQYEDRFDGVLDEPLEPVADEIVFAGADVHFEMDDDTSGYLHVKRGGAEVFIRLTAHALSAPEKARFRVKFPGQKLPRAVLLATVEIEEGVNETAPQVATERPDKSSLRVDREYRCAMYDSSGAVDRRARIRAWADLVYSRGGRVTHVLRSGTAAGRIRLASRVLCGRLPHSELWLGTGGRDEADMADLMPLCPKCLKAAERDGTGL